MTHRIVSLLPSATEIVVALGYESALVGRSHECDVPSSVKRLPICSEPRIDINAPSAVIDQQVKSSLQEALSIFRVINSELQRLQPTMIITQTQCEVCAVNLKDVEAAVTELLGLAPTIVPLLPMSLDDIWADIRRVANSLGASQRGHELVATLQQLLQAISARIPRQAMRPRVACIEWIEPLMSAGNWIPELVEIAGGECLLATAGHHSPWLSWPDLITADPDVIIVMPCGFDMERTAHEFSTLTSYPEWQSLRAVRSGRVALADGHLYFNRPGPRVVESAEILAEILHGPAVSYGHQGHCWRPASSVISVTTASVR